MICVHFSPSAEQQVRQHITHKTSKLSRPLPNMIVKYNGLNLYCKFEQVTCMRSVLAKPCSVKFWFYKNYFNSSQLINICKTKLVLWISISGKASKIELFFRKAITMTRKLDSVKTKILGNLWFIILIAWRFLNFFFVLETFTTMRLR